MTFSLLTNLGIGDLGFVHPKRIKLKVKKIKEKSKGLDSNPCPREAGLHSRILLSPDNAFSSHVLSKAFVSQNFNYSLVLHAKINNVILHQLTFR